MGAPVPFGWPRRTPPVSRQRCPLAMAAGGQGGRPPARRVTTRTADCPERLASAGHVGDPHLLAVEPALALDAVADPVSEAVPTSVLDRHHFKAEWDVRSRRRELKLRYPAERE